MTMNGKTCLVTGATSGIGLEAALELARRGATVVLAARDRGRGEQARRRILEAVPGAAVEVVDCDLSDLASVRAAAAAFRERHKRLDVLLNNAGVWHRERKTTKDGLEDTFEANHLGPFLLTSLLLDLLKTSAPSRIVNVTSKLHFQGRMDFGDLQMERAFSGQRAYSNSKLANVLFTRELSRRLEGAGVTVNCVHPGVIATGLTRDMPAIVRWLAKLVLTTPEKGARPLVHLAADPEVGSVTGQYFDKLEQTPAASQARNDDDARRLWQVSEELARVAA